MLVLPTINMSSCCNSVPKQSWATGDKAAGLGGADEDPRRLRAGLPSRRPLSTPAHRRSCVLAVARGRLCVLSRYICAFSARRKPLVERPPEFLDFPAFFDFDRGTFGIKARIYETTVCPLRSLCGRVCYLVLARPQSGASSMGTAGAIASTKKKKETKASAVHKHGCLQVEHESTWVLARL